MLGGNLKSKEAAIGQSLQAHLAVKILSKFQDDAALSFRVAATFFCLKDHHVGARYSQDPRALPT